MASTILKSSLRFSCPRKGALKTRFSGAVECLFENGGRESSSTDFIERGHRPLCKALKVVEASFTGKPIYPIIMGCGENIQSINHILQDVIDTLERGETYSFCECNSTKLRPSPGALMALQTAYVKFKYFGGLVDTTQPLTYPSVEQLLNAPVGKCSATHLLVRQASKSIYCSMKQSTSPGPPTVAPLLPPPADDLELRYQKLLGL